MLINILHGSRQEIDKGIRRRRSDYKPGALCPSFLIRIWTILFLMTTLTSSYAQATLGAGIVKIEFDDKTILDFYKKPTDKTPCKRIEFFEDKAIHNWNIKNLKTEQAWLKPEVLWLDYSQFNFRCISTRGEWLELMVNNETGQTYWIKKDTSIKFLTWEEYLKEMFAVDRLPGQNQKIRKQPTDRADEIRYEGRDCFQVKSLKGNWIEIFTTPFCDEGQTKTEIKSGWIKWRRGNELLIKYYTTS